jgi:hypothetical protein
MLSGTDLSHAYGTIEESFYEGPSLTSSPAKNVQTPTSKQAPPSNVQPQVPTQISSPVQTVSTSNVATMDPNFLTADQKLHLLSAEFQKQKEMFENNKGQNIGYFDKLLAKKKDVTKLIVFSLVVILALSLHDVVSFYIKQYLDEAALTSLKEFCVRILYPILILFVLWNIRAFTK